VADGELIASQIEVVNTQLAALLSAQSGAVEQTSHQAVQAVASFYGVEETTHFLGCQHGRQALGPFGPQSVQTRQFDPQHLLIQKQ
jgi:hypothetical protein